MDKVSTVNHEDLGLDVRFSSKSQMQWRVPTNTVVKARHSGVCP